MNGWGDGGSICSFPIANWHYSFRSCSSTCFVKTPDLQQFANRQIASGKYTSLDEMMLAGLRMLAGQEQFYQERFEELQREVLLGVLEAERAELLDAASEIEAMRQRLRDFTR
jgi:antitoxin ParD1/3/4